MQLAMHSEVVTADQTAEDHYAVSIHIHDGDVAKTSGVLTTLCD